MYSFHRPYGQELENYLAVYTRDQCFHRKAQTFPRKTRDKNRRANRQQQTLISYAEKFPGSQVFMQLEILLTVYFALLGLLNGGSLDPDDERKWGIILTVGTSSCIVLGFFIVSIAVCKIGPDEPALKAMKRTSSTFSGTLQVDDPVVPGAEDIEMSIRGPQSLRAENAILEQNNERLRAEIASLKQNETRQLQDNARLHTENSRLQQLLQGHVKDQAEEEKDGTNMVEQFLVEPPASPQDMERRANAELQEEVAMNDLVVAVDSDAMTIAEDPSAISAQAEAADNEEALKSMLAMGLQRHHCDFALERCRGVASTAIEFCLRPTVKFLM